MTKVLVGLLLIAVVGIVSYIGCDGARARLGVAGDKAVAKIDKLLGEINVKQKKVENAYNDLKNATAVVREKRIEAEVRLRSYENKKKEMEASKQKLLDDIKTLKEALDEAGSDGKIERNGKVTTADELKTLADLRMKQFRLLKDKLNKNEIIAAAWAKNLDLLKKNETTSADQLSKLESQLEKIRSKKSALDAMKEATTIVGPEVSISDKFNDLTKSVEDLLVDIDTQFEVEQSKLDERMAEMTTVDSVDIDEVLGNKSDVSKTVSDLDALLKEEGKE